MKIHYTYIYLDPLVPGRWTTELVSFLFEPFYVGEGKGSRKDGHLKHTKPSHKVHRILARGSTPYVLILKSELTKCESVHEESKLIISIGTREKLNGVKRGPLTNLIAYRDGNYVMSEATKLKISLAKKGKSFTQAHKHALSIAVKSRPKISRKKPLPFSDEHRANLSKAQKGRVKSDQERANISAGQQGKVLSDDHKKSISAACRGRESPNAKNWLVLFESGAPSIIVHSLRSWCLTHDIPYTSLMNTKTYGTFYRGMRVSRG